MNTQNHRCILVCTRSQSLLFSCHHDALTATTSWKHLSINVSALMIRNAMYTNRYNSFNVFLLIGVKGSFYTGWAIIPRSDDTVRWLLQVLTHPASNIMLLHSKEGLGQYTFHCNLPFGRGGFRVLQREQNGFQPVGISCFRCLLLHGAEQSRKHVKSPKGSAHRRINSNTLIQLVAPGH